MSMMATTTLLYRCSSSQSSNSRPSTAAGTLATRILHHSRTVGHLKCLAKPESRPLSPQKGHSFLKYSTTTAMMAPSWMTTRNISMNSSDRLNFSTCSARIMCPVLDTGSHSVMPSMMP